MMARFRCTFAVLTTCLAGCATPASQSPSAPARAGTPHIVVDGAFDDWRGVPASVSTSNNAPTPTVHSAWTSADGEALFLRFALSSPVVLQAHDAATRIVIDVDGLAATGADIDGLEGADVVLEFSPAPANGGTRGGFVARTATGTTGTAHDVGYTGLPTHLSDTFEARIERATLEAFAGVKLGAEPRARIVSDAGGGALVAPGIVAWNPPPPARVALAAEADALERAPGTDVRVVQWNVADRTIRERPDAFVRVLRALAPDVLLLDELPATIDDAELGTFLARLGPDWSFALGAGGGRQRAAVASRLPLEPAPDFERVAYPDSVTALLPLATFPQTRRDLTTALQDGISAAGAYVELAGGRVLFVAVDLACCGGAESVEDRFRRIQADAINRAARAAVGRRDDISAIVVGGDFNLVGSRRPLEILGQSGPPVSARLRLQPVHALQLDGRTAATWRQDGPFGPGRLDWILYSPWSLAPLRAFVFESRDLSGAALERLGVRADDSDHTSDHLPVVADLRRSAPVRQ